MKTTHLPTSRRHDIDALRVFAFALLILYHASGIWQADSTFHVASRHGWEHMDALRIVFNRWRMPLIFALSGIAIGLAVSRPTWMLAAKRSWQLLLPLVFGMLTTVAIQAWCEARLRGTWDGGFTDFWLRYLQLRPWPAGTFSGAEFGITWNHLWYLPYLWCYTMLLFVLMPLSATPVARLLRWRMTQGGVLTTWLLPVLSWLAALLWLQPRFPESHALLGDWYAHAMYFTCFLAGWLIAREEAAWQCLVSRRWWMAAVALLAIFLELALKLSDLWLDDGPLPAWALNVDWRLVERAARAAYGWSALLAILGFARRWMDRPFRWLPYANEAVYPWYILHQTVLVLIGYWVLPLGWAPEAEVIVILGGTIVGCALLHELLIRRLPWLRPLFGLRPVPDAGRSAVPPRRHASHPAPAGMPRANCAPAAPPASRRSAWH